MDTHNPPTHYPPMEHFLALIFLKFDSYICSYQKTYWLYFSSPCKKHEPEPRHRWCSQRRGHRVFIGVNDWSQLSTRPTTAPRYFGLGAWIVGGIIHKTLEDGKFSKGKKLSSILDLIRLWHLEYLCVKLSDFYFLLLIFMIILILHPYRITCYFSFMNKVKNEKYL